MRRLNAWILPAYALVITFLAFFLGWPGHQQSAAESPQVATVADAAGKAAPLPEATAANRVNYPIPAPAKPPKHLFHFVIRYEGDGLIDQSAVEACKSCLSQAAKEEATKASNKPAPAKSPGSNLFQFIVRYEGDGIIDNNVVDFFKAYMSAMASQQEEEKQPENQPSPATQPAPKTGSSPKPSDNASPSGKPVPESDN
jgi:hypothetical protein